VKKNKRIYHHPHWSKDGLRAIKVTPFEHELIHQMEYQRVAPIARGNQKTYFPACYKLILLYKSYLKRFKFIKAFKLRKVLKIYGLLGGSK